jgi:dienelactone hydrolase
MGEPEKAPGSSTDESGQKLTEPDQAGRPATTAHDHAGRMRTETVNGAYLVLPVGPGPHPGVVVVHEASGLNGNIRDICSRFAAEGYAALGVDLFQGRNRAVCMARMFAGGMAGNLGYYGVPALKAALGQLASHPEVDAARIGAIGFCLGGSIVLTWACTESSPPKSSTTRICRTGNRAANSRANARVRLAAAEAFTISSPWWAAWSNPQ